MREAGAAAVLLAAVLATGGCGGGSATTTTTHQRAESAQELPKLPAGWKVHRDRSVGYAIGIPTGWQVSGRGDRTLIRSPDHLVAVTLTADRAPHTFKVPVKRFAAQALGALPGFKVPLEAGRPKPVRVTPLEGAMATATGEQAGGLKERATVIVLRRDHLVNYTVAVLENAQQPGLELDRAVALRMVRTLRDVPPRRSAPGADGSG